jgi:hypothetical protein
MYLKRLRWRQSTRGSALIFIHFCASCSPRHLSQKNLSSDSSFSVALRSQTRHQRPQKTCQASPNDGSKLIITFSQTATHKAQEPLFSPP